MRRVLVFTSWLLVVGCSTDQQNQCTGAQCLPPVEGGTSDIPPVSGGGCDSSKPVGSGGCPVQEELGVFVWVNAPAGGTGTKASPFKTIQDGVNAAKTGKQNVFVCEGSYDEHVTISNSVAGVAIHGGYACPGGVDAWTYASKPTSIAPTTPGVVVRIDGAAASLEDFSLTAKDGAAKGDSSITTIVNGSIGATFRRAALTAGNGAAGAAGISDATNLGTAQKGNDATNQQAPTLVCQCGAQTTTGGGGATYMGGMPAGGGLPLIPNAPQMSGGPGMNAIACNMGGDGHAGASANPGISGPGATSFGSPTAQGWTVTTAGTASDGALGQGGGGGGNDFGGNGGGGACGGCGGHGGGGGGGGGASIAILTVNSSIRLQHAIVLTAKGGTGWPGGAGQTGQSGGNGGAEFGIGGPGCAGGPGGNGGKGGDGGGGAGGVSIGIVWVSSPPQIDAESTITLGAPGNGAGTGASAGVDGVAAKDKSFN